MPFVPPPPHGRKLTKPQLWLVVLGVVISLGLAVLTWWIARQAAVQ
jgi:hypothetical protein